MKVLLLFQDPLSFAPDKEFRMELSLLKVPCKIKGEASYVFSDLFTYRQRICPQAKHGIL